MLAPAPFRQTQQSDCQAAVLMLSMAIAARLSAGPSDPTKTSLQHTIASPRQHPWYQLEIAGATARAHDVGLPTLLQENMQALDAVLA